MFCNFVSKTSFWNAIPLESTSSVGPETIFQSVFPTIWFWRNLDFRNFYTIDHGSKRSTLSLTLKKRGRRWGSSSSSSSWVKSLCNKVLFRRSRRSYRANQSRYDQLLAQHGLLPTPTLSLKSQRSYRPASWLLPQVVDLWTKNLWDPGSNALGALLLGLLHHSLWHCLGARGECPYFKAGQQMLLFRWNLVLEWESSGFGSAK